MTGGRAEGQLMKLGVRAGGKADEKNYVILFESYKVKQPRVRPRGALAIVSFLRHLRQTHP